MTIDDLRKFCLSLPHATEDVKWGNDLCFCIGGKMFCVTGLQEPIQATFKVTDEEFEALTDTPDIVPAPYVARYKWVLVQKASRLKKKEWEHYVRQSYELVKAALPAKTRKQLE